MKWKKKINVKIVGFSGASGSGKTTVAQFLCKELNSPFILIEGDFYYKKIIPKHQKYQENWELPECFDFECLIQNISKLKLYCQRFNSIKDFENFPTKIYNPRDQEFEVNSKFFAKQKKTYNNDANETIYIIVDSFLLYFEPRLCNLIDFSFFIDCTYETSLRRRCQRDSECTKEFFDEMVWHHYLIYKNIQLKNAKNLILLNGSKSLDEIKKSSSKIFFY